MVRIRAPWNAIALAVVAAAISIPTVFCQGAGDASSHGSGKANGGVVMRFPIPRTLPDDHILAMIEDRPITVGEIHRVIGEYPTSLSGIEQVQRSVFTDLEETALCICYSERGPSRLISARDVDVELQKQLASLFDGNRDKFDVYLWSINRTAAEYRVLVEERMIVDAVRAEVRKNAKTPVSEMQSEEFYANNRDHFHVPDGVRLRLIRLAQIADENQAVLQQATATVMRRLRKGEDFGSVAKEFSQDNYTKKKGGDMGWMARADLRDELATAAFALDNGRFSEPIKLDRDIYILFVENKRNAGIQSFKDVRDQIERLLVSQMQRDATERFFEELRRTTKIQYFD